MPRSHSKYIRFPRSINLKDYPKKDLWSSPKVIPLRLHVRYDRYSSVFPTTVPTDVDLAYAAGFIDGEGSIYGKEIRVINTNEKVLIWFKKTFGGKIYIRKKLKNRLQAYVWRIGGKDAEVLLKKLKVFLKIKGLFALQNNAK